MKEADGDVKDFKTKATEFIVFLKDKFDELQFYTGPSFDVEGTLYFALTKEGNTTPTFYILTPGLKKQKTWNHFIFKFSTLSFSRFIFSSRIVLFSRIDADKFYCSFFPLFNIRSNPSTSSFKLSVLRSTSAHSSCPLDCTATLCIILGRVLRAIEVSLLRSIILYVCGLVVYHNLNVLLAVPLYLKPSKLALFLLLFPVTSQSPPYLGLLSSSSRSRIKHVVSFCSRSHLQRSSAYSWLLSSSV